MHVHNAFPYLLIRCYKDDGQLNRFMHDLAKDIDRVLNINMGCKDPYQFQHVYKIEKHYMKPMYGYHEKQTLFLKILFYNPEYIKKYLKEIFTFFFIKHIKNLISKSKRSA